MFGLFKRTKIQEWETALLRNVIEQLPAEYAPLIDQLNDGLLRGARPDETFFKGHVGFSFEQSVVNKYDKPKERDYKLTNIKVYDRKPAAFVSYDIYVGAGMICGYTLGGEKKKDIDVSQIDTSAFKKQFIDGDDYARIKKLLTKAEKDLINASEVYSVILDNKEYFHIIDLEDGDFVGMDDKKVLYKITHDPMEIVKLDNSIADLLDS